MIHFFGNTNSKLFAVQTTKELTQNTIAKLTGYLQINPK